MKKLFLTLLVVVAGVVNASAADDLYLRSDYTGTSHWDADDASHKFTFKETNSSNEDVYEFVINASDIKSQDVWFRLHINNWGAQICPYTENGSYSFTFTNGQNETYGAKYERTYFQGSTNSFGIPHSKIKANQYKITVYKGNTEQKYENEDCKVMWIKVDIVNMPVSISASGFASLVSDRALDFTNTGITAYTATDGGNGNANLNTITLAQKEVPMLLKATQGTYNVPVIPFDSGTAPEANAFKPGTGGALASTEGSYKNYILNNGEFYLANNKTVGKDKAYLQLAASNESKARLIFPDGETTSISTVFGHEGESEV